MIAGQILHIQRLSTEDGPGIRTTVFFKGCPMHCAWCHNPESISSRMQTQWFPIRCLDCHTCIATCPNACLKMEVEGLQIDRSRCEACGKCGEACPSGALEIIGRMVTADELVAELLKDRAYFEKSGGGVTLSGGEPTFQPDFAETLLRDLKAQGIHTALDTCGLTLENTFDHLLPYTDLVLFDLKIMDPDRHEKFTGVSNRKILENLVHIREIRIAKSLSLELWIRTPLIPGATASEGNIRAVGQFLTDQMDGSISRWELCAFNNLCRDQYSRLGLEWPYTQTPLMTARELAHYKQIAKAAYIHPDIVMTTGATSLVEML